MQKKFRSLWETAIYNVWDPQRFSGKEPACSVEDQGLIPASGRSPGEGNGNPLQYSCLGNPMDRGAWWTTVQRVGHDGTHSSHTSTTFRLEGLENSPPRKVSSALRPFLQPLKMVLLYGALKNLLVLLSITCVWYTGSLSMALPHLSLNILLSSVTERDVESWKDPAFGLK